MSLLLFFFHCFWSPLFLLSSFYFQNIFDLCAVPDLCSVLFLVSPKFLLSLPLSLALHAGTFILPVIALFIDFFHNCCQNYFFLLDAFSQLLFSPSSPPSPFLIQKYHLYSKVLISLFLAFFLE